jgi:alginate O-acetyltransferase complex protein AlgI
VSLWAAAYAFGFQIYMDFSAYTDIARGTAKLLGYELMINFNSPYRSLNVGEFWKRWHISLSSWFRDYLYIPLGGSRSSSVYVVRNILIVFLLSGLWHGAAWNFVLWGLFHGVLLSAYTLMRPLLATITSKASLATNRLLKVGSWFVTFHLVIVSWVFFRAESTADIGTALGKMLINPMSAIVAPGLNFIPDAGTGEQLFYILLIAGCLLNEFIDSGDRFRWSANPAFRGIRTAATLAVIFILFPTVKEQFIYFQF